MFFMASTCKGRPEMAGGLCFWLPRQRLLFAGCRGSLLRLGASRRGRGHPGGRAIRRAYRRGAGFVLPIERDQEFCRLVRSAVKVSWLPPSIWGFDSDSTPTECNVNCLKLVQLFRATNRA